MGSYQEITIPAKLFHHSAVLLLLRGTVRYFPQFWVPPDWRYSLRDRIITKGLSLTIARKPENPRTQKVKFVLPIGFVYSKVNKNAI